MPKEPKPDDVTFHEETTDPLVADARDFYKVEKWTSDETKVNSLLYAGNSLGRARSVFERGQASAAYQIDDPAADTGDRSVTAAVSGREKADEGRLYRDAHVLWRRALWRITHRDQPSSLEWRTFFDD
jgi:hypothetical protein